MSDALAVLLKDPDALEVDRIAAFLAAFHKQPMIDTRRTARRCWGFLAEGLDPAGADALSHAAAAAGLDSLVLPADQVPSLPAPQPVYSARFTAEGFVHTVGTAAGEHARLWNSFRLFSASGFKETHSSVKTVKEGPSGQERMLRLGITLATGIPLGGGRQKEVHKVVSETELSLVLELFAAGPSGLERLRIVPQHFDFSFLGDRRAHDIMGNFRMLLPALIAAAPKARLNRGVKGFQSGVPLASHGYDTAADMDRESRWLLALEAFHG